MTPAGRRHIVMSLALAAAPVRAESVPVIPADAARSAFLEARALCRAEGGKLWGRSLCVPLMFVDAPTRQAVLSQRSGGAVPDGKVYRLTLPAGVPLGNTSVELGGDRWSMVLWPLPTDATARHILLMHESYHNLQPGLGLTGSGGLGTNGHLETRDGRVWFRAELAALRVALGSSGPGRTRALRDALLFREYRRSLFKDAASEERGVELNEGLAESTGVDAALVDHDARIRAAIGDIDTELKNVSFMRAFAYASGPAYAELMSSASPSWRRSVTAAFDFGVAAARAYGIKSPVPDETAALAAIDRYDGQRLMAEEDARAKRIAEENARFTSALVTGATLSLPLKSFSLSMDPTAVHGLPDQGSVYEKLSIDDGWGSLEVSGGLALITPQFDRVVVPLGSAPSGTHLRGAGWSLDLKEGYGFRERKDKLGSFEVARTAEP